MSRYTGKPCADCGKKKGPKQRNDKRCFTCAHLARVKASAKRHGAHVTATYNITPKQYEALLAFQANRCAICRRATGRTKRLAVDHNHRCTEGHEPNRGCPECVRGLLCATCNEYIGRIRDDPEVGLRLASYLRSPPFQQLRILRP